MKKSNGLSGVANTLLLVAIIGAINWGLIGLFNFNLVEAIFGTGGVARAIYAIVGLCGLAALFFLPSLRVIRRERLGATTTTTTPTSTYGRGYDDRADLRR